MLWIQFPKILCFSLQPGLGDQLVQKGSGENCWTPDRLPNLIPSSLKVLMAGVKPSAPAWAGIGDFDVVRTDKVYSSWRSYTLQQSVSEETELFDENKKLVLTLGCRCGTGRRTGGSWSAPTWGWLHLNTKAGLLVGEGTALPPSTYIWQLSIPVCAPFTVFSPRWDGEGFTTNSSSWVGIRDREGQKLPNGEHPAIHWNR